MRTTKRTRKRVTIKIDVSTFESLSAMRKDTGAPITVLMAQAVARYAHPRGAEKRTRIRKLRGSR